MTDDELLEQAVAACEAMINHLIRHVQADGVTLPLLAAFLEGLSEGAIDAHAARGEGNAVTAEVQRLRPLLHALAYKRQSAFSLGGGRAPAAGPVS